MPLYRSLQLFRRYCYVTMFKIFRAKGLNFVIRFFITGTLTFLLCLTVSFMCIVCILVWQSLLFILQVHINLGAGESEVSTPLNIRQEFCRISRFISAQCVQVLFFMPFCCFGSLTFKEIKSKLSKSKFATYFLISLEYVENWVRFP